MGQLGRGGVIHKPGSLRSGREVTGNHRLQNCPPAPTHMYHAHCNNTHLKSIPEGKHAV